ncbi:MAG TPA: hypothetical protein VNQ90_00075 [Chthoniobacteraceae bacterium]|nr:hypothetical protein [Chthoniobacteraceae bacterium]
MNFISISVGGPDRKISIDGKIYTFEMHPYCGPCLLNGQGDPVDPNKTFMKFLEAASLWAQQGERIGEDGLCIYDHPPEPIKQHIRGRHWKITGYTEPRRGE